MTHLPEEQKENLNEEKISKNDILIYSDKVSDMFPVTISYVFKPKMSIPEIIDNLITNGYASLSLLKYNVDDTVMALVVRDSEELKIWLIASDDLTDDVLLHECIHVTFRLFEYINSDVSFHTEEIFAYTTQFIFNKSRDVFENKFKFKIKKETKK